MSRTDLAVDRTCWVAKWRVSSQRAQETRRFAFSFHYAHWPDSERTYDPSKLGLTDDCETTTSSTSHVQPDVNVTVRPVASLVNWTSAAVHVSSQRRRRAGNGRRTMRRWVCRPSPVHWAAASEAVRRWRSWRPSVAKTH